MTLQSLDRPNIIQEVVHRDIFADLITRARLLLPDWTPTESDPMYLMLWDTAGYIALRNEYFNTRMLGMFLRYATESDLDNLVALLGVVREEGEGDESLRARAQREPFTRNALVSELAIESAARSVLPEGRVVGAKAQVMSDYTKNVYIATDFLGRKASSGNPAIQPGTPTQMELNLINEFLNAPNRKYITDEIYAVAPIIRTYQVRGTIRYNSQRVGLGVVQHGTRQAANDFVTEKAKPGLLVNTSLMTGALTQVRGVERVDLTQPNNREFRTQNQYDAMTFPTRPANRRPSGVATPEPYLPASATLANRLRAANDVLMHVCFPDALDETPSAIQFTYTDIA